MLQVNFVKELQKHILSFSKVLCAPSGEWLLPLHIDSVLWRRSNSSSATTLRWNFPQTFCVLNQQPFLLFVKILCALSTDAYSMSSKPVKTVPSLPSHLQRTSGNTSRIRARRTWELYVRTQLTKLNEFLGSSRSWRPNKTKSKENSSFPPNGKGMMLSAQTMYTYRFARKNPSFEVLVFYILPVFPPPACCLVLQVATKKN